MDKLKSICKFLSVSVLKVIDDIELKFLQQLLVNDKIILNIKINLKKKYPSLQKQQHIGTRLPNRPCNNTHTT